MAAGFGALREDQVGAGSDVPPRVLSGPGQDGHHDVVGKRYGEQRLVATAWFTRHYWSRPHRTWRVVP
jgi:hypothetical protein